MHSFSTLLVAGAIASTAFAKPLPQYGSTTKKGFTVTGSIPKARPAPAVQYSNAFKKYGKQVPQIVAAAISNGSVVATPEASDVAYLCPVTIGGETLNLDFDTGSADL